jgi:flagellar biosynthesis protein FlhG
MGFTQEIIMTNSPINASSNLFIGEQIKSSGNLSSKKIWALGGGKGGIGKTFVSASLGITLAQKGNSVVVIDLDLGGANLHTTLGISIPKLSLSDFIAGRVVNLDQLLVETTVSNLKFISGANDSLNVANLETGHKENLIRSIHSLPADYVILDLGAGTSLNTLDFFITADRSIVVITPEPTSIENVYRFIKSSFYRKLKIAETHSGVQSLIEEAMDHKNLKGIRSPADLIRYVASIDPVMGKDFLKVLENFQLGIIINQIRTRSDIEVGFSIQSVCKKYFGVSTHYLGYLDHDNAVWQSIRKKKPLITEFPYSPLVTEFSKIVDNLIHSKDQVAVL